MFKYFKISEYCLLAMIASMGVGIKIIVVPLAQIITGPLFIPGGVVAGGIYMAFIVLGASLTKKRGACTLVALIQAVMVTITGTIGTHGAISLLTYTLPGIGCDLLFLVFGKKFISLSSCFLAGIVANMIGSFSVNLAIFNLSFIPLMLSLTAASFSGGIGGIVAYHLGNSVNNILYNRDNKSTYIPLPDRE